MLIHTENITSVFRADALPEYIETRIFCRAKDIHLTDTAFGIQGPGIEKLCGNEWIRLELDYEYMTSRYGPDFGFSLDALSAADCLAYEPDDIVTFVKKSDTAAYKNSLTAGKYRTVIPCCGEFIYSYFTVI